MDIGDGSQMEKGETEEMVTRRQLREERDKAMELGAAYRKQAAALSGKVQDYQNRVKVLEDDLDKARRAYKEDLKRLHVEREEYKQLVLTCMAVVRTTDARVRETLKTVESVEDTVGDVVNELRSISKITMDQIIHTLSVENENDLDEHG